MLTPLGKTRPRNKLLIVISGPSVPEPWVIETLVHGERDIHVL